MISVIVPVYNVDKYLRPCIESILCQTYADLQIILVDDGSTDSSGRICDEYADRDSRIEVIHQKNAGVSGARNCGMDAAKGEFISFVDGDDYIHPYLYEVLLESISEGKYAYSMVLGKQVFDNKGITPPPACRHHTLLRLYKDSPYTRRYDKESIQPYSAARYRRSANASGMEQIV